jgi:serine/threonine protein kinase
VSDPHSHPSREQLTAFVHGQLPDDEQRVLETHIAHCDSCCNELRLIPHDDLVERLRNSTTGVGLASAPVTQEAELSPLTDHPRYQIERELGKGGMGVVYLARHRVMGRMVALKVINRRLLQNQMAVERFRQEVQAAARLNHRNIVTAFDAEQAGDLHFLVMEYVEGTDLATMVSRRGPLPVLHACNYAMQAAQGLQHAHEQGMVHRDIKPQNLMRTRKGTIKILDFGLARLASPADSETVPEGLTVEGVTLGTPDYIAPEQARDARRADIRSDIYSLGCTLYYLLTGAAPHPTGTAIEKVMAHCTTEPIPVRQLRADLPSQLVEIIERMMAKDSSARFQTPAEVAVALKPFGLPGASGVAGHVSETAFDESDSEPDMNVMLDLNDSDNDFAGTDSFALESQDPRELAPTVMAHLEPAADQSASWKRLRLPLAAGVLLLIVGLALLVPWPGRDGSTQQTLPGSGDSNTDSSASNGWIDLIPQVNPTQHAVAGNWQRRGNELIVDAATAGRLALPFQPPAEYDMEVEYTRQTGTYSIALMFAAGSGQATFELDAWGEHLAGFQLIDGRDLRAQQPGVAEQLMINGQRYRARVEVRRDGVTAFLNDRELASYRGNGSNLQPLEMWRLPAGTRLGVGAYDSATTFHSIRVRPRS